MEDYSSSSFPGIDREFGQGASGQNQTGTPERRLLLAMLERAILDFVGNDQREVQEAEDWLFGEIDNPSNERFTFPWLCEHLDLDMYKISEKIRAMPRRGNRKIAPWYFSKNNVVNISDEVGSKAA